MFLEARRDACLNADDPILDIIEMKDVLGCRRNVVGKREEKRSWEALNLIIFSRQVLDDSVG